jgi:ATP-dependent DNA helicase RecG
VLVSKKGVFSATTPRSAFSEASLEEEMDRRKAETRLKTILKTSDGFQIAEVDLKLRGPGEFFGTKQSGLPELQIADIIVDGEILRMARKEAFRLVAEDPELRRAENQPVRKQFIERYKDQLVLVKSG